MQQIDISDIQIYQYNALYIYMDLRYLYYYYIKIQHIQVLSRNWIIYINAKLIQVKTTYNY